jgi:hypothetical protein
MNTHSPELNAGLNLERFIAQKHFGHLNLNDPQYPLNIISFTNTTLNVNIIKLMGQYIKPTKFTFLGKTIIPTTQNSKNIQYPNQSNILKKNGISTKSNIFDISPIYMAFINSFHMYSKTKIIAFHCIFI